jgi:hypothetical protein
MKTFTSGIIIVLLCLLSDVTKAANNKKRQTNLRDPKTTVHKTDEDPHRAALNNSGGGGGCESYTSEECASKSTEYQGTTVSCCTCTKLVPVVQTVCVASVTQFTDNYDICSECSHIIST